MRTFVAILGVAVGLVLLVLLGVAIAVWTIDPNQFIGPLQARIKAATGRDIAIGGGIDLKLGLEPRLVINDVRFGNAPWAKTPDMLTAKSVEAQVALLPLLQRRFDLVRLNLVDPVIALETNAQGQGNWELGAPKPAPDAAEPGPAPAILGIGDLAITRGTLSYRDGATGAETSVVIDELSLRARDAQSPVNAEFRGKIDGIAVALTGNLGPLATLAERRLPYPVAVQGDVAGKKSSLALKLQRSDGLVELQDVDATSGSSDAKGKVSIRQAGAQSATTVELVSKSLTVEDLPLPVAFPAPTPAKRAPSASAAPGRFMFSDAPISFDALRKSSANGSWSIDHLVLEQGRSFDNVRLQFALRDGKLDVPSFQAAAFGGTVAGRFAVDTARTPGPAITLAVEGHRLDLQPLLSASGVKREVRGGKTEISIDVAMHGNSLHQWMSGISGRARAVVGPATIVNTKLDPTASFDQLAQLVNPFRTSEPNTDVRCAVVGLPLANGIAQVDRSIALETKELDVGVSGTLDFRNETLDLSIRPRVRQGITVNITEFASLVRFHGPFSAPAVGVDAMASAAEIARIGAAVGTGGLSVLGETLLSAVTGGSAGGAGACDIAMGKGGNQSPATADTSKRSGSPSTDASKRGGTQPPADDLGKGVGPTLRALNAARKTRKRYA